MRILQLTDLHIGAPGEKPFDVDVRKNFLECIQQIKTETFDLLVISGDLCFRNPETAIYNWIQSQLNDIKQPTIIMAGNHDSNEMINEIFYQNERDQYYFIHTLGNVPLIFLDSASQQIDQKQLTWFSNQLHTFNHDIIVFIHHPIGLAAVPHMDKNYALNNYNEVHDLIATFPHQVYAFCGHYHLEKTVAFRNLHNFITPSTFFQIDDRHDTFEIATHRVGYRQIDWDGQTLFTKVRFLDSH